jgi:hypothetical protein
MDSNYIINRLKSTPFKYPTVGLMRSRLENLDEKDRNEIFSNLKVEVWKHRNADIHEPLLELIYKMPMAS